ncbi:MAG: AbrB/MazE/SpoVT family DNA-binding domain-containing protein [Thermoflexales bacterium]|nr:AbrB/MazE/SpoVT family DNA-binding domain-containing protein [Thermoflexales bacterium]
MHATTLTQKGQVTIPKAVRRALGLKPGDRVFITLDGDRALLLPVHRRSLSQLRGALPATAPFPGHQQIREGIRRQRGEMLRQEGGE